MTWLLEDSMLLACLISQVHRPTPTSTLLLKPTTRTTDICRMEHAPWWADGRLRLGLLLAGLAVAMLALLSAKTELFNRGSGSAQARGTAFAPGCPGQGVPEVKSIPGSDVAALRNAVLRIMPPRVGRVYEAGTITASNLWSDAPPQRVSPSSSTGSVPAGYETRWWALDRDGSEDDVVADVLEFATERQAEDALARAASPHCRPGGAAHAGRSPSGAVNLFWVNPDGAQEWDVLFVRDRRLYRVVDAPPGFLLTTTQPAQRKLERLRAARTVSVLACALPDAGCQASAVSGSSSHSGAPRPITRAQMDTYARAVNLRGYDVPGMTQVTPEGPIDDRGSWEAFARCTGELHSTHIVVSIHSPIFTYGHRLRFQSAYSTVAVLPTERAADRYLAVPASPRARACIINIYDRSLPARAAERKPLRLGQIAAAPLPA